MAISKEDAPFLQLINNKYMLTMYTHILHCQVDVAFQKASYK